MVFYLKKQKNYTSDTAPIYLRNFSTINTTLSTGSGSATQVYNIIEIDPANGDNFYRIRSIGARGETTISRVVKVTIGKNQSGITVYPNPVINNTINLQMTDVPAGLYHATLINTAGQLLLNRPILLTANSSTNTLIPSTDLLPGIYQLKVTGPNKKVIVISLEVQREL